MKRVISAAIIIATLLFILTGCTEKITTDAKIGLAAPDSTHGWVAGVSYFAEKYCKDNGIDYMLTVSADKTEMKKNISSLIEWGAKTIVVWPQWSGMENAVDNAINRGVKVVSFDVDIDSDSVYKVTGNNYDMGYQCADYILGKTGKNAVIAVLEVPSAGSVSQLRKQGFYDYLAEKGFDTSNIIEVQEDSFSREAGYSDMKKTLSAHSHIDAVFSMDDEVSIGAVKAICESGRTDIKAVTGGGGMQEYFNMIKDEKYSSFGLASALYSPSMIEDAINTAIKLADGKETSRIIVLPTTVVSSQNVDEYIDPQNSVY